MPTLIVKAARHWVGIRCGEPEGVDENGIPMNLMGVLVDADRNIVQGFLRGGKVRLLGQFSKSLGGSFYGELAGGTMLKALRGLPPGGQWKTIRGAKVYVKGGKVLAGPPALKAESAASVVKPAGGKVYHRDFPMSKVVPDPTQARKSFDPEGLRELAESIKSQGLVQPITLRKVGGKYQIVAGERRWRAHKLLGAQTIEAHVQEMSDKAAKAVMLLENLVRKDLNPMEEANAYADAMSSIGWDTSELAKQIGKSPATVEQKMMLRQLLPELQQFVSSGQLGESHGRQIAKLKPDYQSIAFREMNEKDLTSKATADLVKGLLEKQRAEASDLGFLFAPDVMKKVEKMTAREQRQLEKDIEQLVSVNTRLINRIFDKKKQKVAARFTRGNLPKKIQLATGIMKFWQGFIKELRSIEATEKQGQKARIKVGEAGAKKERPRKVKRSRRVAKGFPVVVKAADDSIGVWRTIRGTHVFVQGGKIVLGPERLKGKNFSPYDSMGKQHESQEDKQIQEAVDGIVTDLLNKHGWPEALTVARRKVLTAGRPETAAGEKFVEGVLGRLEAMKPKQVEGGAVKVKAGNQTGLKVVKPPASQPESATGHEKRGSTVHKIRQLMEMERGKTASGAEKAPAGPKLSQREWGLAAELLNWVKHTAHDRSKIQHDGNFREAMAGTARAWAKNPPRSLIFTAEDSAGIAKKLESMTDEQLRGWLGPEYPKSPGPKKPSLRIVKAVWDEAKHPRLPRGRSGGGRFGRMGSVDPKGITVGSGVKGSMPKMPWPKEPKVAEGKVRVLTLQGGKGTLVSAGVGLKAVKVGPFAGRPASYVVTDHPSPPQRALLFPEFRTGGFHRYEEARSWKGLRAKAQAIWDEQSAEHLRLVKAEIADKDVPDRDREFMRKVADSLGETAGSKVKSPPDNIISGAHSRYMKTMKEAHKADVAWTKKVNAQQGTNTKSPLPPKLPEKFARSSAEHYGKIAWDMRPKEVEMALERLDPADTKTMTGDYANRATAASSSSGAGRWSQEYSLYSRDDFDGYAASLADLKTCKSNLSSVPTPIRSTMAWAVKRCAERGEFAASWKPPASMMRRISRWMFSNNPTFQSKFKEYRPEPLTFGRIVSIGGRSSFVSPAGTLQVRTNRGGHPVGMVYVANPSREKAVKVSPAQKDLFKAWDESRHPRIPRGDTGGGRFTRGAGGVIVRDQIAAEEWKSTGVIQDLRAPAAIMWEQMSANVYGSTDYAALSTREMLQNSMDAIETAVRNGNLPAGGGRIDISEQRGADHGSLTFKDNGCGMDLQDLQDRLLTLSGTGKADDERSVGGFGMAKAVIFGACDKGDWQVVTRQPGSDKAYVQNKKWLGVEPAKYFKPETDDFGTEITLPACSTLEQYTHLRVGWHDGADSEYGQTDGPRFFLDHSMLDTRDIAVHHNGERVEGVRLTGRNRREMAADWGEGIESDLYVRPYKSKARGQTGRVFILINGLLQFHRTAPDVPADVYLNFTKLPRPKSDTYPFPMGRDNFRSGGYGQNVLDTILQQFRTDPATVRSKQEWKEDYYDSGDMMTKLVQNLEQFHQVRGQKQDKLARDLDRVTQILQETGVHDPQRVPYEGDAKVAQPMSIQMREFQKEGNPLDMPWIVRTHNSFSGRRLTMPQAIRLITGWDAIFRIVTHASAHDAEVATTVREGLWPGIVYHGSHLAEAYKTEREVYNASTRVYENRKMNYFLLNPKLVRDTLKSGATESGGVEKKGRVERRDALEMAVAMISHAAHELAHLTTAMRHDEDWSTSREAYGRNAIKFLPQIHEVVKTMYPNFEEPGIAAKIRVPAKPVIVKKPKATRYEHVGDPAYAQPRGRKSWQELYGEADKQRKQEDLFGKGLGYGAWTEGHGRFAGGPNSADAGRDQGGSQWIPPEYDGLFGCERRRPREDSALGAEGIPSGLRVRKALPEPLSGGVWRTMRGSRVYIKGGRVVAGPARLVGSPAGSPKAGQMKPWDQIDLPMEVKVREPGSKKKVHETPTGVKKKVKVGQAKQREIKIRGGRQRGLAGIHDVGEKIGGARKDLWWGRDVGATVADLKELEKNPVEARRLISKQNLVGRYDLEVEKSLGRTAGGAYIWKKVHASIAARPPDDPVLRRLFTRGTHVLQEAVQKCKSADDLTEAMQGLRDLASMDTDERAALNSLGNRFQRMLGWRGSSVMRQGRYFDALTTKEAQDRYKKIYRREPPDPWDWSKPAPKKAERERIKPPTRPDIKVAKRDTGGFLKRYPPATPADFIDRYQLRGAEFGNWVEDDVRRWHVWQAHMAFGDLAQILGLKPQQISGNGHLAIGFGARGTGRASAHYEPGKVVINLTKNRGGGSLAHEWAHFFDNFMGGSRSKKTSTRYLSDLDRLYGTSERGIGSLVDADVAKAMNDVTNAIHYSQVRVQEQLDLYERRLQKRVEAIEKWEDFVPKEVREGPVGKGLALILKQVNRQAEKAGRERVSLPRLVSDFTKSSKIMQADAGKMAGDLRATHKLTKKQGRLIEGTLRSLQGKDTDPDGGRSLWAWSRELGRTYSDVDRGTKHVESVRARGHDLRQSFGRSEFSKAAVKLGVYWARPIEMYARAFESYVEDKLESKGAKNQYLVHGTRSGYGYAKAEPYPQANEREVINAAFDKFFKVLKKKKKILKALENFAGHGSVLKAFQLRPGESFPVWRTMRGSKVQIGADGKIVKGPKALRGQKITALGVGERHKISGVKVSRGGAFKVALQGPGEAEWVTLAPSSYTRGEERLKRVKVKNGWIVSGRYKGVKLSDMVRHGRMVESKRHYYDPETGAVQKMQVTVNGRQYWRIKGQAFAIRRGNRILVMLPQTFTKDRRALEKMGLQKRSGNMFYVTAKDFDKVADVLGGLDIDETASNLLRGYADEERRRAEYEEADSLKDLQEFNITSVKGMIPERIKSLHGYQLSQVRWLITQKTGICGLDMGMGKTVVAITGAMKLLAAGELHANGRNGKVLVIAPPQSMGDFQEQIGRHTKETTSMNGKNMGARFEMVSYDYFRAHPEKYRQKWGAVILDEAHRLKDPTTKQTGAIHDVLSDVPYKWALTGTPMTISPVDLYNVVGFVSPQGLYGPTEFKRRFMIQEGGRCIGVNPETLPELRGWAKKYCTYLASEDWLPNLPDATPAIQSHVKITMDQAQARMYRKWHKARTDALGKITDLVRKETGMEHVTLTDEDVERLKSRVKVRVAGRRKLMSGSAIWQTLKTIESVPEAVSPKYKGRNPKMDHMVDWITGHENASKIKDGVPTRQAKTMLIAHSVELQKAVIARLEKEYGPGSVSAIAHHGNYAGGKRQPGSPAGIQATTKHFNENPDARFIVLSSTRAKEGLNLQQASGILNVDEPYTPGTLRQQTARGLRQGNPYKHVDVGTFVMSAPEFVDESVDEAVMRRNIQRHKIFTDVLAGQEEVKKVKPPKAYKRVYSSEIEKAKQGRITVRAAA